MVEGAWLRLPIFPNPGQLNLLSDQRVTAGISDPPRDNSPSSENEIELFDFFASQYANHSSLQIGWETYSNKEFVWLDADLITPGNNSSDTMSPLPIRNCLKRLSRISRHSHSIRK